MATNSSSHDDDNRTKTHFLSMVTHELRSPLNAINGYLDLTLSGMAGELNEQQREFIQRARAGSEHLYTLIEDLLLVSRADSGQMRLNLEWGSLQDIVANAQEELEMTALDGGVKVISRLPADFPLIYVDSIRLQQALRNLLSNALHFTPADGSVTIAARLIPMNSDASKQCVEIRVSDTGCGIPEEHKERIFDRFFQAPQATRRTGGHGLGLAIVKMVVELHGGYVRVTNEAGQGSTFVLTLDAL